MNNVYISSIRFVVLVLLLYVIKIEAAVHTVYERTYPDKSLLKVEVQTYETNNSRMHLIHRAILTRTNSQMMILWTDSFGMPKESAAIMIKERQICYDAHYDETNGVFILVASLSAPVTVTYVQCPPYPGKYIIPLNNRNWRTNDYAWELVNGNKRYFYGEIASARIANTGSFTEIEVTAEAGGKRRNRRNENGWGVVHEDTLNK